MPEHDCHSIPLDREAQADLFGRLHLTGREDRGDQLQLFGPLDSGSLDSGSLALPAGETVRGARGRMQHSMDLQGACDGD